MCECSESRLLNKFLLREVSKSIAGLNKIFILCISDTNPFMISIACLKFSNKFPTSSHTSSEMAVKDRYHHLIPSSYQFLIIELKD